MSADAIVTRDLKEYEVGGGQTIAIAQVETVGQGLDDRRDELMEAMARARERHGYALYALMVTDILAKDTDLYVSGDAGPLEQAFGPRRDDGVIPLPGVMSRKKQVAPKGPCRVVNLGSVGLHGPQKAEEPQGTGRRTRRRLPEDQDRHQGGEGRAARAPRRPPRARRSTRSRKKTPIVKRIPVVVGAGVAALVATKVVRGRSAAKPARDLIPPLIPAPAVLDVRPGEPVPLAGAGGLRARYGRARRRATGSRS